MTVRSCRVTIQDLDGVSHTVELTAATLYEAVALGLAAIRGNQWARGDSGRIQSGEGARDRYSRRSRGEAKGLHELAGPEREHSEGSNRPKEDPGYLGAGEIFETDLKARSRRVALLPSGCRNTHFLPKFLLATIFLDGLLFFLNQHHDHRGAPSRPGQSRSRWVRCFIQSA
jgi:hypothetical protein